MHPVLLRAWFIGTYVTDPGCFGRRIRPLADHPFGNRGWRSAAGSASNGCTSDMLAHHLHHILANANASRRRRITTTEKTRPACRGICQNVITATQVRSSEHVPCPSSVCMPVATTMLHPAHRVTNVPLFILLSPTADHPLILEPGTGRILFLPGDSR